MVAPMFLPKLTRLTSSFVLAGFAATGCGSDATSIDEDGVEDSGSEGDSSDGTDTSDTTDTGETDAGTDTDDPPPPENHWPATGISIQQVEANQGTAVFIGEDGEWVAPQLRLSPLTKNRNTLIRVHYDIDPNFVPREIEARLILTFPDASTKVYTQTRMVEGPSAPNSLGEIFYFGLVAEAGDVVPGVQFKVEFHEIAEGGGGGEAMGVWQTPPESSEGGIQPEPIELKVMFVPFHHLYDGIDRIADTSDATMELITTTLYEQNPVEVLIWEVHEPEIWDQPMENLGAVLGPVAALRDNEMAFPNWYYHALFPVPGGGVAGVAGIASVPGDGLGEGGSRVAATAQGSNGGNARDVVLHEVGHNQGLNHVACPFAQAASPDPTYPHQNGLVGHWGFGIVNFNLVAPDNHYDYMSYCNPSWASQWSFTKTFKRMRTLTSWDYEDASAAGLDFALGPMGYEEKNLITGAIHADGSEFWWTHHGTLPSNADPYGDDYDHYIELRSGGEIVDVLPAVVRYTNEFSTAWVIAELPEEYARLEGIDTVVRVDEEGRGYPVSPAKIQLSRRPQD